MAWYRQGSVSVTNGSKVVTGSGTAWSANVQAGDAFHAPDGKTYEIDFVSADASLNLVDAYAGTTASGQSYKVQPTQGRVRDLAAAVSTLIAEYGSIESALSVASGMVGIGVSPTRALDVSGVAARFRGDSFFHEFYNSAGTTRSGYIQISASDTARFAVEVAQALALQTGGVDRVVVDPSGNVGIGTNSPGAKLDVAGSISSTTASGGTPKISLLQNGIVSWELKNTATTGDFSIGNGAGVAFQAQPVSGGVLGVYVAGAGNVGVGTSSPVNKLHVLGAGRFSNGTNAVGLGGDATSAYVEAVSGAAMLRLKTGGADRMTVDSSGNIGLAVTPKAWNTNYTALDNRVYQSLFSASSGVTGLAANAYFDAVGWKAKSVNKSVLYQQDVASGAHIWSITAAPASGSGVDPGFTEAMRIDSAGNLLPILQASAPALTSAGQAVFNRISDTQVRLSMRGADGNTRSTTLTLA